MNCRSVALCLLLFACEHPALDSGIDGSSSDLLTRDQLLDPEQCRACHPRHYEEWSGSMHAYAADDPVFLAMNRRPPAS